jgi:hypothetical protein
VGSQDFVHEVYDASYRRLVAQLFALCGDQHDAEEIVQEAFVKALRRRAAFAAVGKLSPAAEPLPPGAATDALLADSLRHVALRSDGSSTLYTQVGSKVYATDDAGESWDEVSAR